MPTTREVVLEGTPQAVPRARLFARQQACRNADPDELELVVAELVTNAVLYGQAPIAVRIEDNPGCTRAEVEDRGKLLPVIALSRPDNMTGRGLGLVSALTRRWGWDPHPDGGKVVWAELRAPGTAGPAEQVIGHRTGNPLGGFDDFSSVLELWPELEDAGLSEPVYTVRLGAVSTELLVDAKSHIDNMVRELTFAGAGDGSASHPEAVGRLIDTVTNSFAEARAEIKRQAVAAATRGEPVTELVLHLPASAATAAENYMQALDESDRYARAARLLTLAAPPAHQVFRRWYLSQVVTQLRAYEEGRQPPPPPSFADALTEEVTRLAPMREAWDRLQLLEKVTGELRNAPTVDQVARIFTRNAVELLGALVVRVYLLGDDGIMRAVASHGNGEAFLLEFPAGSDYPAAQVVRSGKGIVMHGLAAIESAFPPVSGVNHTERSLHIVPLQAGHDVIGCLSLSFPFGTEAEETSFLSALGDTLAQALQRSVAMEKLEQANERLSFLAAASVALTGSLDTLATAQAVTSIMVPRLADGCVVHLVADDRLVPIAVRHRNAQRSQLARAMSLRYPVAMTADMGPARVARTGRSELYADVDVRGVEQWAHDPDHLAALRELGVGSVLAVPLIGRSGAFGAVTLVYDESGRHYGPDDLIFAEDVARRGAMALETARLFEDQSQRLANVTSIAQVAQQAILAPLPARIGPVSLSGRYLSATAEAQVGGDLYEAVARPGAVRLLIGDVKGKGLTAVRTTTVVLGEFRAAAADQEDLPSVAAQIDRRLRSFLEPEDFVTALIAEVADDGTSSLVSCGHPSPLRARDGQLEELAAEHGVPLGLGGVHRASHHRLLPGDRLLLYTDGLAEARDAQRRFVDLYGVAAPVATATFAHALDELLHRLSKTTGPHLGDDLALLLAQYQG